MSVGQDPKSVESFGWEWTRRQVVDTRRELYHKLFISRGVWYDYYNDKVVADVGSGGGRFTWALTELTQAKKIISVELSPEAVTKQRSYIIDPRVEIIQGDIAKIKFKADIIYCAGVIQHTADPLVTLENLIDNLNENGELLISFYMRTFATTVLRPIRFFLSRLPKEFLWKLTPFLALIFMVRKSGRTLGIENAMHTAYDWFGSHKYQYYFTDKRIMQYFFRCGVSDNNILQISKGMYKVRKGIFPLKLDDTRIRF